MTSARRLSALLLALLLVTPVLLRAQQNGNDRVKWSLLTSKVSGAPGEVVQVKLKGVIESGWHTYSTKTYEDGPSATVFTVGDRAVATLSGRVKGTPPTKHFDEGFEMETETWSGTITLSVPVKIAKDAKPGSAEAWVNVNFQVCQEGRCLPSIDKKLPFTIEIAEPETGSADSAKQAQMLAQAARDSVEAVQEAQRNDSLAAAKRSADSLSALAATKSGGDSAGTVAAAPGTPTAGRGTITKTDEQRKIDAAKKEGLFSFMLLAIGAGLLALLTPCTYPMIPITVSFFTKRPNTTRGRSIRDALLYGLGILFTFTALGFLLTLALGASGVNDFAANPVVNILMAVIFVALALSLFGMYEIQLPTSMMNKLNAKANEGGVGGIMLMGVVFSLMSFTCTVPFVSAMLSGVAEGEFYWPLIGTATFAATFAFPFVLLALFPSWMKALPKSGGWLNSVKVVMGFLEVALAVRYLANADMVWSWNVFTREIVLALWIASAVMATLYLLGRFQMPHDTPLEKVGPVRVLIATAFLGSGFWLLQGMFGGDLGDVDSLIPPPRESVAQVSMTPAGRKVEPGQAGPSAEKKEWIQDDYQQALAESKRTGRPIFVDFTGYTCTNCRWMERRMFPRPEIAGLMDKFILVRLYTDRNDSVNQGQQKMMYERYRTIELPFYVLVSSSDSTLATSSYTRDAEAFAGFLRRGLGAPGGENVAMR